MIDYLFGTVVVLLLAGLIGFWLWFIASSEASYNLANWRRCATIADDAQRDRDVAQASLRNANAMLTAVTADRDEKQAALAELRGALRRLANGDDE